MDDEVDYRAGYIQDDFDPRDYSFHSTAEANDLVSAVHTTQPKADASRKPHILKNVPPVYTQGNIGSCTANAVAAALRYAYCKSTKWQKNYEQIDISRLHLYYYGRATSDPSNPDQERGGQELKNDGGCGTRAILSSVIYRGVCKESIWPYGKHESSKTKPWAFKNLDTRPNPCEPENWKLVNDLPQYKLLEDGSIPNRFSFISRGISYNRIFNPNATVGTSDSIWQFHANMPPIKLLESVLDAGYPFIFGVLLYKYNQFRASKINDGVADMPPEESTEKMGKHALLAVGYDHAKSLFLVQNSWGNWWDAKDELMMGRFWMPYKWFTALDPGNNIPTPVTFDCWCITFDEPT
jgi:hypothetical protein